ncbi:hypothetical protein jhhlp_000151 [Lomentospora prolificans]|uniref:Uncharacterized protein n=1 Tax=Lomentospora prolificans TaxID=41688 RepID=A0A2N3NLQ8_9PEZI|nr:hypothetical protein jhhlp_000151 [Lomentospora prolificans]
METIQSFTDQWTNPSEVTTVLMVIGGDIVQKALAQSAGTWFSPVCFSFGWVMYAFVALVNVVGDGRLLPRPDYPAKVFNLKSGYVRENQHWVIGRLVRDSEATMSREYPLHNEGIRICVYEAEKNNNKASYTLGVTHYISLGVMICQLLIAAVPLILDKEWGILLITAVGTILALWHGALPQWVAEKMPNRQHASTIYALTAGNGHKDIMVIKGKGNCLNLEELATPDTPRNGGPWEKFWKPLSKPSVDHEGLVRFRKTGTMLRQTTEFWGQPRGFWVTKVTTIVQSVLWLVLLVCVSAIRTNTWFLMAVGGLGMFQNAILAAVERKPSEWNLPLRLNDVIVTKKVMDGLMDLEVSHGCGEALLQEFFPGKLTQDEKNWWYHGDRKAYDDRRNKDKLARGPPRSRRAQFEERYNHQSPSDGSASSPPPSPTRTGGQDPGQPNEKR